MVLPGELEEFAGFIVHASPPIEMLVSEVEGFILVVVFEEWRYELFYSSLEVETRVLVILPLS